MLIVLNESGEARKGEARANVGSGGRCSETTAAVPWLQSTSVHGSILELQSYCSRNFKLRKRPTNNFWNRFIRLFKLAFVGWSQSHECFVRSWLRNQWSRQLQRLICGDPLDESNLCTNLSWFKLQTWINWRIMLASVQRPEMPFSLVFAVCGTMLTFLEKFMLNIKYLATFAAS